MNTVHAMACITDIDGYTMMKDKQFNTLVGLQLREARKKKGWTQLTLALESSLSPSFIGHVESGRRGLSLRTACMLTKVIGCSIEELTP